MLAELIEEKDPQSNSAVRAPGGRRSTGCEAKRWFETVTDHMVYNTCLEG
jgi:hypothetical protein